MITIDSIHRLLAIAEVGKDPYAVANAAASLLAANAQDRYACGHYVRALAALKLGAAAGRLMTGAGGGAGGGGGGHVPWASRGRRFAANVRALGQRTAAGAGLVEAAAARDLACFELHQAGDGNFQVLQTGAEGGGSALAWVSGLADHKATTALLQFNARETPIPNPVAFDGLGFGWLFMHLAQATANSFLSYSCALYILESDPLALAMLFHMHDLQELIAQPRTRWFVGTSAEGVLAEYRRACEAERTWTLPDRFIRGPLRPRAAIDVEGATAELRRGREARRAEVRSEIAGWYGEKTAAYWRKRFEEPGEPLRVLGITSRYTTVLQHSLRELQAAAREVSGAAGEGGAGFRFEIAMELDDQSLENPFLEEIGRLKPDLIVQISRLRHENPQLPANVPFLSWDQDNLAVMRTAEATAGLNELTYVAGHAAVFGYTNLHWPRKNCIFCHAAAATLRYRPEPAPARALMEAHACDISYVSNASGPPGALLEQLRERWKGAPGLLALLDELAREVLARSAAGETWEYVSLRNLARGRAAAGNVRLDDEALREMTMDLNTFADRAFRHTALEWVSRWCVENGRTLRLYGNGWDRHPVFGRWAAGHAPPGEEARAIFQASRINLQLIQPGFIHSRALDGLAAGGFFLTRFTMADGLDSPEVATLYRLARWVVEKKIETDAELEAVEDPEVRAMTAATRAYYLRHEVTEPLCPSLHIWAEMPAAACLFPRLWEITFRNQQEFAMLVEKFLDPAEGEALRRENAIAMRGIVESRFSYAARWRTFLGGIREGLGCGSRRDGAAGVMRKGG
jgi:hypothetical protein